MLKFLVVCILLVELSLAATFYDVAKQEWNEFKTLHQKKYDNIKEENLRYKIYLENRYKIAQHNARYHAKEVSFKLGLNKYSDLLQTEMVQALNGFNRSNSINGITQYKKLLNHEEPFTFISPANVELPMEVDWRTKGAVTGVKDQGHCGSCYTFSATGSLEGQHFRKTGILVSLSEQNLVDCSHAYGNNGCSGGLMSNSFSYIRDNGGVDTEESYPYEAKDDFCHFKRADIGATDKGFIPIPEGNELALKIAVATIGPVSVAIDASHGSFSFYSSGIYHEPKCSAINLDHGVLAVGYGTENGVDYWIIKNSWGTSWGENGYIKMIRNKHNHCGIATQASYPLV